MQRKAALKAELVSLMRRDLAAAEAAHKATTAGVTHEEAKPENDKDTRALEQSYLARGQAQRVEELRIAVAEVESMMMGAAPLTRKATLGALVTVGEGSGETVYWIAPQGGGARLEGGVVQVVTPKSPLGQTLVGKAEGDECDVVIANRARTFEVLKVE
jgi:transcription elongation GreA/GreB family factor